MGSLPDAAVDRLIKAGHFRKLTAGQTLFQRGDESDSLFLILSGRVKVSNITETNTPARTMYEPNNPLANAEGVVTYSNVNPVEEMVNMISASRSYQNNVEVMNTAKSLLLKTLQMGQ